MDSSLIRKVEKARSYASDPGAFTFERFSVQFHGTHREHRVSYDEAGFRCDCEYFALHRSCSHTMALERVFNPMLSHL